MLKRLRLGYLLNTLPERLSLARRDQMDYAAFLQILLADEVTRRNNSNLEIRLQATQDSRRSAAWRTSIGQPR